MTRSQCDTLSADVLRIMLDMEDEILRMIAAQIGRDGNVSDTSKWRIRQLARSGRMKAQAAAVISSYLPAQEQAVYDAVIAAAAKEIGYLDNAVQAANAAGLANYFSDVPAEDSAVFAAKAFQEQAASDLNLVNTVMQYKAGSTYVDAINGIYFDTSMKQDRLDDMGVGAAMFSSGHVSLQEATRRTIRRMARKGIPAFVDKSGREWSPEAYVMMDMRSTLGNTARAAQNMRCDQYGIQLIEVSSHMGARPKCAPYQGRIFSRDGTSGVTTDLNGNKISYTPLSSTSYGQPDGLFGINCGHVQYPYLQGLSIQRYFPYDEEENAERYKQFQRQRAMERDIRVTKRECMMLQAAGDEEGLQKASQRLRAKKQKYSQYSKDCGLGTHYDRTQVYGFDRSKSAKTVWAERKAENGNSSLPSAPITQSKSLNQNNVQTLTSNGVNGIINPIPQAKTADEAYKMLIGNVGFKDIDASFRQINPEMIVDCTNQLIKLDEKFGAVKNSVHATIMSKDYMGAIGYVSAPRNIPTQQQLSLCPATYKKSKADIISDRLDMRERKRCMPFADEDAAIYNVTHEYGHMLQNVLIQQRMIENGLDLSTPDMFVDKVKLKSKNRYTQREAYAWYEKIRVAVAKECKEEILAIAIENNPNFNYTEQISEYGENNIIEFFAEVFANSQLGSPNELGNAMNVWLKRKGLTINGA